MTQQRASELLAMIKVEEQSELTVNSWWGSFEKDYKEALQMAIEALEQQPCEDDVSKFISRQVSLLEERMSSATSEGRWVEEEKCQCAIENLELVDEYIKAHPPVTPKEKTAKWIRTTDKSGHLVWECDKCGWQQRFNTNFCPNCGARMVSK